MNMAHLWTQGETPCVVYLSPILASSTLPSSSTSADRGGMGRATYLRMIGRTCSGILLLVELRESRWSQPEVRLPLGESSAVGVSENSSWSPAVGRGARITAGCCHAHTTQTLFKIQSCCKP